MFLYKLLNYNICVCCIFAVWWIFLVVMCNLRAQFMGIAIGVEPQNGEDNPRMGSMNWIGYASSVVGQFDF